MKHEFSRRIFEKLIPGFMRIRRVGAEFHADGWLDITKPVVAFRKFANAPINDQAAQRRNYCLGGFCPHPTPTIACLHDSHKHDIGTNGQVTGRVLRNEQREVRIP